MEIFTTIGATFVATPSGLPRGIDLVHAPVGPVVRVRAERAADAHAFRAREAVRE